MYEYEHLDMIVEFDNSWDFHFYKKIHDNRGDCAMINREFVINFLQKYIKIHKDVLILTCDIPENFIIHGSYEHYKLDPNLDLLKQTVKIKYKDYARCFLVTQNNKIFSTFRNQPLFRFMI